MCAEASRFWTTGGAGDGASTYTAANFAQFLRETFMTAPASEGVLYGIGNNLAVTGASSPVAVNTGAGLVYGIFYTNDASVNVAIPTPASSTRVDVIVLRASWAAQTVRITRVAGTEGAGVPAITQVANTTWDIPLANVSITTGGVCTVTDVRTYVKHPGVYGWLNAALTIGGALTVTGNVTASQSLSGSFNEIVVSNTSNTAGSYARLNAKVAGTSADDPLTVWEVTGAKAWSAGIDNSDSDKFKIAPFSVLGGEVLTLDDSGNLTVTGALSASSLEASQLGSGTVPLARLSGITTTQLSGTAGITGAQLSGTAGITNAQIAALDAAKVTTGRLDTARLPIQTGSGSTNVSGLATITFGTAFSSTPTVVASTSSALTTLQVYSVSTSGFTIQSHSWDAVNKEWDVFSAAYSWLAIGAM